MNPPVISADGSAQRSSARDEFAAFRSSALATRSGLDLVLGQPDLNWLIDIPRHYARLAPHPPQQTVTTVIEGHRNGMRAELVWLDGRPRSAGQRDLRPQVSFDARISVAARSLVMPFEVCNRRPVGPLRPEPAGLGRPRLFGDATLDAQLTFAGGRGASLPSLAAGMHSLLDSVPGWVHLTWDGMLLSYALSPMSIHVLAAVDDLLSSLVEISLSLSRQPTERSSPP